MDDFRQRRERMVAEQLQARGIRDSRVLDAMRRVPREAFVRERAEASAYEDHPLPIDAGQTISQPYIVALTLEAAELGENDTVLDVGTGSGYAAAVAAELAHSVVSIERHAELAESAAAVLGRLGYDNVTVVVGDGTNGYPPAAPYDAIVAAAAAPEIPSPWADQLADGGRIIMPIGEPRFGQMLTRAIRGHDGRLQLEQLCAVTFVPLIGDHGVHEHPTEEE
ncbi:protein-L-isoaspartate(D-aspartate) O-methyltransferase [Mycetocola zhujimingii]|uniref:Protein-L-isoaspartate O-methyltransferase n=1 Tax=Mycetocola zhujimingii TaxID=2079792 RepID=A0A2U1TGC5_9MICO|nr:protein-L-isoaspartate(D-aspartate) O-methyltransferase [Mycetocola zhujimingii]AWB86399.1 protein-L-isoaspartate O-methyltransferase [Mycetocola zhujimingii]PWC07947.1 protein-L-isoaspartate(D-aspartate) O-methyltransferase [Mycetocola zhujimingii]